jgi:hypothetical protein
MQLKKKAVYGSIAQIPFPEADGQTPVTKRIDGEGSGVGIDGDLKMENAVETVLSILGAESNTTILRGEAEIEGVGNESGSELFGGDIPGPDYITLGIVVVTALVGGVCL